MSGEIEPTSEQLKQLYRVLTWLTRMYLPVYLVQHGGNKPPIPNRQKVCLISFLTFDF
ncbi:DUF6888 family protein [uncultured Nostoc sp.]|uniref:DUF6888 family protein n=1 Tax=uncultured Nostoc sp. TaxID=340711 RepID=UPI0035CB55D8